MSHIHEEDQDIEDSSLDFGDGVHVHDQYDKYYYDHLRNIRYTVPWLILVFGLIGNILIMIVFGKKLRTRSSNALCFCALAISDSAALIFMAFRVLLKTEILSNLNVTCKLIKFLYHFFLQMSSWCLVLLTIDRLLAVTLVFRYSSWSKRLHVLKVLIGVILVVFLVNMHLLIFIEPQEIYEFDYTKIEPRRFPDKYNLKTSTKTRFTRPRPLLTRTPIDFSKMNRTGLIKRVVCNVSYEKYPFYYDYIYTQWDIYHAVIYGILPFVIILISNLIIIARLTCFRYKPAIFVKQSADDMPTDAESKAKSFQLTLMLLTIAFAFLILTSPMSFYMAFIQQNIRHVRESKRELIKAILRYICFVNNAINFYIYLFLSNEFRKELKSNFGKCCNCLPTTTPAIYQTCTSSLTTSLPDITIERGPRTMKVDLSDSSNTSNKKIYNNNFGKQSKDVRLKQYENIPSGVQTEEQVEFIDGKERKVIITHI